MNIFSFFLAIRGVWKDGVTDTGWLTVLEKNGFRLAADIFENYGIDSETDLSVLDQDDFIKLASRGLNVSGRGPSTKKQGARQHDVKPGTLKKKRVL